MLIKIAVVLFVLWLLGIISSVAIGGAIHILLLVALGLFLWTFLSKPKRS